MPIYEYKCSDCGEKFEKIVSFQSTREIKCPECSCDKVKKLISLFGSTSINTSVTSPSAASCGPTRG